MRPAVSVALIVCGAIVVLTPPIYSYLLARVGASVLAARSDIPNVNIGLALADKYWFGCFALGAVTIVVAIVGAFKKAQN